MKKYIYTILAATALLSSCSQDADNEVAGRQPKGITSVSVSTWETNSDVDDGTDNTMVNWESGDHLGVFGTDNSSKAVGPADFTLEGDGGSTSGAFRNDLSTISTIQAMMYPYQTSATWDNANGKLTCEIPTVQTATDGSYDKTAAVMYSIGSSTNATLKYANAFLQVHVGTNNIHAITVYGSTALSGKVEITDGGVTAASSGSTEHVTFEADSENGALRAGGHIIAVKPGVYNDVFIAYKYTDHTAKVKSITDGLTLTAGYCTTISVDFSTGTVRQAKQL